MLYLVWPMSGAAWAPVRQLVLKEPIRSSHVQYLGMVRVRTYGARVPWSSVFIKKTSKNILKVKNIFSMETYMCLAWTCENSFRNIVIFFTEIIIFWATTTKIAPFRKDFFVRHVLKYNVIIFFHICGLHVYVCWQNISKKKKNHDVENDILKMCSKELNLHWPFSQMVHPIWRLYRQISATRTHRIWKTADRMLSSWLAADMYGFPIRRLRRAGVSNLEFGGVSGVLPRPDSFNSNAFCLW